MQKITPFLWFDGRAEEAANFYVSVFGDARIVSLTRYGEAGPLQKGKVMAVTFELEGQEFMALNGGPHFTFTPAVSFFVKCGTQAEVDYFWDKLSEGGTEQQCGWVTDKFGLSWQVIPIKLGQLLGDKDGKKAQQVMSAMLWMRKIDIAGLERAYAA
jgi:predicted 3-demethylubiquinone-9 3-methyltransferase (glyoxalase superfamily)